jgi:hypothetical protein
MARYMAKPWSNKETNLLIKRYKELPIGELLKKIPGRTKSQIYAKAHALGLKKKTPLTRMPPIAKTCFRTPPDVLNENGKIFWNQYLEEIDTMTFVIHTLLTDLCYWEQRKVEARDNLEKGRDVVVYRNPDKSVKHVQTSAFFSNLRSIQSEVNTLRNRIFKVAVESKPAEESKLEPLKKRLSGFNG